MQVNQEGNGFSVVESQEDVEKKNRKQRMVDRKTQAKTKITNQDIWDLLIDIQARLTEQ